MGSSGCHATVYYLLPTNAHVSGPHHLEIVRVGYTHVLLYGSSAVLWGTALRNPRGCRHTNDNSGTAR